MSPARRGDQSCFEPVLPAANAKDLDNTSHDVNRIHFRFRRVSGKGDEPESSIIEKVETESEIKVDTRNNMDEPKRSLRTFPAPVPPAIPMVTTGIGIFPCEPNWFKNKCAICITSYVVSKYTHRTSLT